VMMTSAVLGLGRKWIFPFFTSILM